MEIAFPLWRCVMVLATGVCHGSLTGEFPSQLCCTRCGQEYRYENGIPMLLAPTTLPDTSEEYLSTDHYTSDTIIRTYYEAQYGPFIQASSAIDARLPLPHRGSHRLQRFKGATPSEAAIVRKSTKLFETPNLTEPFYQAMRALCEPHVTSAAHILDVGCGLGRMTGELAALTEGMVVGIDRSPRMAHEAARLVTEPGPHDIALNSGSQSSISAILNLDWQRKNVRFVVADAQLLPIADAMIDCIVCLNVLDRIAQPAQMIAEFQRVLKPKGTLIIADPYHWDVQYTSPVHWVENMRDLFAATDWKVIHEVDSLPFLMRYEPRRVTLYQNHCLIYRKLRHKALRNGKRKPGNEGK